MDETVGLILIESCVNDNYTPLHFASLNGHLEVVKNLISQGANIEIPKKQRSYLSINTSLCDEVTLKVKRMDILH